MPEMLNLVKFLVAKAIKKARFAAVRNSSIHPTSKIESGTSFVASAMDRYSFCGYDCDIYRASIGSFTSIANRVVVGGARHPMDWVGMSPVFYAGRDSVQTKFSKHELDELPHTLIGNDVWIGQSAIILSGIKVGDGAVIGAGSVVTKDVPSYAIVAGNPSKLIRYRFEADLMQELGEIQWWNLTEAQLTELAGHIKDPRRFVDEVKRHLASSYA